jgi:hypothetical protein
MSLIFDSFPSTQKAEDFVAAVRKLGIRADVWNSGDEMNAAGQRAIVRRENNDIDPKTNKVCDVFPFALRGAVVTVRRFENEAAESKAEAMVSKFGGVFAGT